MEWPQAQIEELFFFLLQLARRLPDPVFGAEPRGNDTALLSPRSPATPRYADNVASPQWYHTRHTLQAAMRRQHRHGADAA